MAKKQDPKANMDALKAQQQRTDQLVTKHEKLLDLYVKQGKSQDEINKKAKTLENAYVRLARIQGTILKTEQAITKEEDGQTKSLLKRVASSASILAITQKMKDAIGSISATQRDTANHMSVTLNYAAKLNKQIASELVGARMVDTTRGQILETMHEMDDAFKSSSLYNAKMAMDLSVVANKLNISRAEAAKLTAGMQLIDGASSEAANNTLLLAKNFADAKGVKFGAVMKDVSAQGKAFANFSGMSLKNMIRTAVETRKMGFELSDAMSVANKLLDIEGSIESQMKFNVLTGKEANFDRARALVIEGDMSGALAEVRDQVGDISKLNILEIQALEQSTGLTREKLMASQTIAETASTNLDLEKAAGEALDTNSKSQADLTASGLLATTAAEANENAQTNIKESLGAQVADQKKLKAVLLGIQIVQGALAAIETIRAIAAVTSMSAATLGIGAVAIAGGIALAAGAMTSATSTAKSSMKDGMIGPDGGMIVSGQKGSIQLDKDDSIIAGTNLGGGGGSSAIAEKLDKMIYLLSQQRTLNVSGTQLAEVMDLESIPVGMG